MYVCVFLVYSCSVVEAIEHLLVFSQVRKEQLVTSVRTGNVALDKTFEFPV
jgi:hypothetical protein